MRAALAEKAILNPGEAIRLYDLSARRFYRLIQGRKRLPFVALYNKRKIDMADEIFVINVGGYIGSSTRSEIEYAQAAGKRIRYLEECPQSEILNV